MLSVSGIAVLADHIDRHIFLSGADAGKFSERA